MAQHFFIPFIDGDFICRKCGVVVVNSHQMQAFIDHNDCIPDHHPRCSLTSEAVRLHIEQVSELEPIPMAYTPFSFQELKEFMDWLNSADPVKELWRCK